MEEILKENSDATSMALDDMIAAAGASEGDDNVAYRIEFRHAKTEEIVGYFDFRALMAPVYRKFQDIANGTIKRKPNRADAVKYVFDKCCIRFELADPHAHLNTGKHPNAKVMFLNEPKLEMVVDAAVNEYLGEARPTVEDVKK